MSTVFVRAANPIWYFVDLQGLGLNDQYYMFFLNNDTLLPQAVYQTPDSGTPWANPLQFFPNGTLPDNLYFNNTEVYRLIVRMGPSNSDPLIYEIDNFVPGNESIQPESFSTPTDNQLSNPQFFNVNFTTPLNITTAGTYSIAPGWDLILTGPGSAATVSQVPLSGSNQQVNNPPYYLRISTTGFTTATLRQRLNNNGALWATIPSIQVGAVLGSITAEAELSDYDISMTYVPSTGTPELIITTATIGFTEFEVAEGTVLIPASSNSDSSDIAYIDINVQLQGTGIIRLSNIQVMGQTLPDGSAAPTAVPYQQETIERGIDHLFHYYKDQIFKMQIPSYLIGWDFSLNPTQILGASVAAINTGTNGSLQPWDQTIVFQSVTSAVITSRDASGALALTASADTQLAIIQYLDGNRVKEILRNRMAVNILGTSFGQNITCTVSLWYTTGVTLPLLANPNFDSIVLTLDANGDVATTNPATNPGPTPVPWTEIGRPSLGNQNAQFIMTPTNNFVDFNFNGFDATTNGDIDSATYFAIVIGTSNINTGNIIYFDSVGLMSGDIATRPAPQTFDEVLRECQYYYEKSYAVDGTNNVGTNVSANAISSVQNGFQTGGNANLAATPFTITYKNIKRAIATPQVYTPSGVLGSVTAYMTTSTSFTTANVALSTWNNQTFGMNATTYIDSTPPASTILTATNAAAFSGTIIYQYVIDARLGII